MQIITIMISIADYLLEIGKLCFLENVRHLPLICCLLDFCYSPLKHLIMLLAILETGHAIFSAMFSLLTIALWS